ncbi:PREDICTED: cell surface glycoprotein 1-like [Priapulus caudatus]|uniref:Cell surface glycoprotein 1-like n=1 Tax=Priapulus caudatus TaxID=37621 RepID=A0ABM1F387_PRICU|nr:PREDICTED: cell surface glycoprotein 1-like [Priapulus caudatus]
MFPDQTESFQVPDESGASSGLDRSGSLPDRSELVLARPESFTVPVQRESFLDRPRSLPILDQPDGPTSFPVSDQPEPVTDQPEPVTDQPEPFPDRPRSLPIPDQPDPFPDRPTSFPVSDQPEPVPDQPEPFPDRPRSLPIPDELDPYPDRPTSFQVSDQPEPELQSFPDEVVTFADGPGASQRCGASQQTTIGSGWKPQTTAVAAASRGWFELAPTARIADVQCGNVSIFTTLNQTVSARDVPAMAAGQVAAPTRDAEDACVALPPASVTRPALPAAEPQSIAERAASDASILVLPTRSDDVTCSSAAARRGPNTRDLPRPMFPDQTESFHVPDESGASSGLDRSGSLLDRSELVLVRPESFTVPVQRELFPDRSELVLARPESFTVPVQRELFPDRPRSLPIPDQPDRPTSFPVSDQPEPVPDQPKPFPDRPPSLPIPDQPAPFPDRPTSFPVSDQPEPVPDQPEPVPDQPEPFPDRPRSLPIPDRTRSLPIPDRPRSLPIPDQLDPYPDRPTSFQVSDQPEPELQSFPDEVVTFADGPGALQRCGASQQMTIGSGWTQQTTAVAAASRGWIKLAPTARIAGADAVQTLERELTSKNVSSDAPSYKTTEVDGRWRCTLVIPVSAESERKMTKKAASQNACYKALRLLNMPAQEKLENCIGMLKRVTSDKHAAGAPPA